MTMNWTVTTSFGTRPPTYGDFIGLTRAALSGNGRRSSRNRNSPQQTFVPCFLLDFGLRDGFRLQLSRILPCRILAVRSPGVDKSWFDLQKGMFPQVGKVFTHFGLHLGPIHRVLNF